MKSDFLNQVDEIIHEHLSNEKFGVSELADAVNMSRSNLLRKIKKETDLSASVYIRQLRLEHGSSLLHEGQLNVSEVAYEVGFGSSSYFIKCFHEQYGYSPGELQKDKNIAIEDSEKKNPEKKSITPIVIISVVLILILINTFFWFKSVWVSDKNAMPEKSIAVLPLINDSQDSSNIYIINGLMESILTNLQSIENLRVISRTSVERYRNSELSIPEIAQELGVNYIVEGSGQKVGSQIQLNIQLIEARTDKHLWAQGYQRNTNDIFTLQAEVAKKIASQIKVIITPDELERINKVPTNNPVAYDYFLQGLELFYQANKEDLIKAIPFFKKAIEHDSEFAQAYADLAISYYYLDYAQAQKQFNDSINYYADQALLYDSKLAQSLLAKALYYMNKGSYDETVTYLEKALEYNPNSALIINVLSDLYTNYLPIPEKYLSYALKGIQLETGAHDSTSASYSFLHLSNALIQTGFIDKASKYIDLSISYDTSNLYSPYVKGYIQYAKNRNLQETLDILLHTFDRDTTRLDIMQEISKIYYYQRNFEAAFPYCEAYLKAKRMYNLHIYPHEDIKLAYIYEQLGHQKTADSLYQTYFDYFKNQESLYQDLTMGMYYANKNEPEKAFEHLHEFEKQDDYHIWTILFLPLDPLMDPIVNTNEFKTFQMNLESKFWEKHEKVKQDLEGKKLL